MSLIIWLIPCYTIEQLSCNWDVTWSVQYVFIVAEYRQINHITVTFCPDSISKSVFLSLFNKVKERFSLQISLNRTKSFLNTTQTCTFWCRFWAGDLGATAETWSVAAALRQIKARNKPETPPARPPLSLWLSVNGCGSCEGVTKGRGWRQVRTRTRRRRGLSGLSALPPAATPRERLHGYFCSDTCPRPRKDYAEKHRVSLIIADPP